MSRRVVPMAARRVLPFLSGALLPLAAGAQQSHRPADGAPVPRELALALIAPFVSAGSTRPTIVVDRVPAWLPTTAVPRGPGAEALGAVELTRGPDMPGYGIAVFVMAGSPDSVLDAYERSLEGAGWMRARLGPDGGGFVPAAIQRPAILCHDSTSVVASAAPRSEGRSGTQLRLTVSSTRRGSPCGEPRDEIRYDLRGGPPVPELRAPAGVASRGSSGGATMRSGGDGIQSREISSRLTTEMSPAAIVAHYAAQLTASGWSPQPPVATGDAAIQLFETSDSTGVRWRGLLTVISAPGAGQRDISMRIVRADTTDVD